MFLNNINKKREGAAKELGKMLENRFNLGKLVEDGVNGEYFYADIDLKGESISSSQLPNIEKDLKEVIKNPLMLRDVSAVYIDGDDSKGQAQRVRGVLFETEEELNKFIEFKAKEHERDHRVIGEEQDLFVFSSAVGKGLPMYTEKGSAIRRVLERFIVDEEIKMGYKHVTTPDIANISLYEKSGHYPYYKENMYSPIDIDGDKFILRPMTCPHHFELYLSKPRSYRELPFRIAEVSKLYRYEKSGELTGLTRVRSFCLSDAHIICADVDQAKTEIDSVLTFIEKMNGALGFHAGEDYWYRLSLGDKKNKEKYYDDNKDWEESEKILKEVLNSCGTKFVEAEDEAAFYGPKIDIQMKSATGKEDTAFTVQYDFVMPKRFKMSYIGKDGKKHEPIIIHRSSIGSIERVIAFLIEKHKGKFPFWISPVQVKVITIGEEQNKYAKNIHSSLIEVGIRSELDNSEQKFGAKIYQAKKELVPYIIILGKEEEETNTITIQSREGDKEKLSIDELTGKLLKENKPFN